MLTVKKFLCFKLETGGKIIGWLGVIGSGLIIPVLILLMVMVSSLSCKEINQLDKRYADELTGELGLNDCQTIFGAFIIICSILIAIYMFGFVIYFLLLRGISNQNEKKILPAVIIEAVVLVGFALYSLANMTVETLVEAIIVGLIHFYIFTVLYSLYVKIRNGNRRGVINVQFNKSQNI
ncbi:hypothetical protein ACKWTF_000873 [Chironomus riparius]